MIYLGFNETGRRSDPWHSIRGMKKRGVAAAAPAQTGRFDTFVSGGKAVTLARSFKYFWLIFEKGNLLICEIKSSSSGAVPILKSGLKNLLGHIAMHKFEHPSFRTQFLYRKAT